MGKEYIKLPKLEGYEEGEGFILVARRKGKYWIAGQVDIIPKSIEDLSDKQKDRLLRDHCLEAFQAVQELYHSNNLKGGRKNGQRISK